MNTFMAGYRKLLSWVSLGLKYTGIGLLVAIVVSIFVQVVSRYIFGRPHVWVEELATYSFIWLVFMGAAYALIKKRHIIVSTVTNCLPHKIKNILDLIIMTGMLLFLFQAIRYGVLQFGIEGAQTTISLPIRLPRRWFYSLPLIISMLIMFITTVYNYIEKIQLLKTGSKV